VNVGFRYTALLTTVSTMMRRVILPALVVAMLALAGCSSGMSTTDMVAPASGGSPDIGVVTEELALSDGGRATADREIITTGHATVTVDEPLDAAAEAARIVEAAGGRIDARSEYAPINGNAGTASLTLRIPSDALTDVLEKLKALGAVQEVSLSDVDVTVETQDLDARVTALRASVDRLLALLATASDTETLIKLETAISERQGELESLESQQRYYADQVSMSTITLDLVSEYTAPAPEPDTFFSGLVAGWNALVAFFSGFIVVVGVLLPWLAVLAVIAGIVFGLVRWRQTRTGVNAPPEA
jgi:hypothetical protein